MNSTPLFAFKPVVSRIILILSILCTTILPMGYAAVNVSPVQAGVPAWYDGLIQYSTIVNCVSIIQGAPYNEAGAGAYVGYLANPEDAMPSPGQVYYIHLVIAGLGNACSGMRAYLDIGLPPNTSLATNTHPVYCFFDNVALPANECPQTLPASGYNPGMFWIPSVDNVHANLWPVPTGRFLEFQIPVVSSTPLTNAPLQGKVWMLDGNSSPWLTLQQGIYVFSSTPTIVYQNPSTTSIKHNTAHSEALLFTQGVGGTGYFDLGTTTAYGFTESIAIPPGGNGFRAYDDWGPPALLPDTTYHWRFRFTYAGGTIIGADQTFRTLPNGVATVGSGATGSCTAAALANALAAADVVKFACGQLPTTIALTGPLAISANKTIDGGGLVTLSANGTNHFNVQQSAHLTLSKIKLINGSNSGACGGSIRVYGNGQLTLTETSFDNNSSSIRGGAVCIDAGATANIHFAQFTNNHAPNGGGVHNSGTLNMDHSIFTSNAATAHGGGLQDYGTSTLSDVRFNLNTAGINGGGIDATGTLTLTRGTFTSNTAGVRGGGINEYTGTLTVTASSFVGNHSYGYGGGLANDIGTVTILASEFSDNTAASVGGGLRSNGTTVVVNSTFSGNHSDSHGGGIENSTTGASLQLLNTTLAGNSASGEGGNLYIGTLPSTSIKVKNSLLAAGSPNNCSAPVASLGYNLESANTCGLAAAGDLVNTNALIGSLLSNGGPTRTFALPAGSPAIDAGTNSGCPSTDARGIARPFDGNLDGIATCDIGAYESNTGSSSKLRLFLPVLER